MFPGGAGGRFHNDVAEKAKLDARLREVLPDMPRWTHHDLRRTARSLMAQIGIADPVAEKVLGHALPGVAGIYNRHRYEVEMADALQRLADHVERLNDPSLTSKWCRCGAAHDGGGAKRRAVAML